MNRAAGLAIGAAVLSATLGVMIGFVIHAGQMERADDTAPPLFGSTSAPAPTTSSTGLSSRAVPTVSSPTISSSTPPGSPPSTAAGGSDTATQNVTPSTDYSPTTSSTPVTTPDTPPATRVTPPATTTSTGTPTSTPATGDGVATAQEPCPALAARSVDAAGTTLYCQVDQSDRTLRWRAVFDGGGCLNQTMTGIGADGVTYACRLDGSGLNHWAPAS